MADIVDIAARDATDLGEYPTRELLDELHARIDLGSDNLLHAREPVYRGPSAHQRKEPPRTRGKLGKKVSQFFKGDGKKGGDDKDKDNRSHKGYTKLSDDPGPFTCPKCGKQYDTKKEVRVSLV